jgi:2-dehydropantoate 2-reductase
MPMVITPSARIAVAGAGSIGCYLGARLALAGRNVTLLLRPALGAAIARHGLIVGDGRRASAELAASALRLASDAGEALRSADVVLVTVKSHATAEMGALIARFAPALACVVSLQNGVANPATLSAVLAPGQRVVAGMVPFNVVAARAEGEAPRFCRASRGTIQIAAGTKGLRAALDVAGARVAERHDMRSVLWAKLLLNLNNALNALSDLPLAAQLADRRWRLLLAAQIAEALPVLAISGIRPAWIEGLPASMLATLLRLPDFLFHAIARRTLAIDAAARSSMWDDLCRHRQTEIDYLQGTVLELADAAGIAAPLTRRIVELVRAAEAAGSGPPGLRPDEIAAEAGASGV